MSLPGIEDLAVEINISIFRELPYADLLACRLVSRTFRDMIDSCAELQYMLESEIAGLVDNPYIQIGPADKLASLKEYVSSWQTFSNRQVARVIPPQRCSHNWSLVEGLLAQPGEALDIKFTELPSQRPRMQNETWSTSTPLRCKLFTMDANQDLLLAAGSMGFREHCVFVLSLATGDSHPLASSPILAFDCVYPLSNCDIRVRGRLLSVCVGMGSMRPVLMWDWQSGEEIHLPLGNGLTVTAAFAGHDHLLLAHRPLQFDFNQLAPLVLMDMSSPDRRAWTFCLPRLADDCVAERAVLSCGPNSAEVPFESSAAAFHASREDQLVVLHVCLQKDYDKYMFSFAFLLSGLLKSIKAASSSQTTPGVVQWSEWGPQHCRIDSISHANMSYHSLRNRDTYGTKHISLVNTDKSFIVIRDYNQKMIRRSLGRTKKAKAAGIVTGPTQLRGEDCFGESVTTYLPYHKVAVLTGQFLDCDVDLQMTEDKFIISRHHRVAGTHEIVAM